MQYQHHLTHYNIQNTSLIETFGFQTMSLYDSFLDNRSYILLFVNRYLFWFKIIAVFYHVGTTLFETVNIIELLTSTI